MPALTARIDTIQHEASGQGLHSVEGGNRGVRRGGLRGLLSYGDLTVRRWIGRADVVWESAAGSAHSRDLAARPTIFDGAAPRKRRHGGVTAERPFSERIGVKRRPA